MLRSFCFGNHHISHLDFFKVGTMFIKSENPEWSLEALSEPQIKACIEDLYIYTISNRIIRLTNTVAGDKTVVFTPPPYPTPSFHFKQTIIY